jgi:heme-degrading monooxygenase HmoA
MILLVYRIELRDESARAVHEEMDARVDAVARATPGYLGRELFQAGPLETVGLLRFESEAAVAAWTSHADHHAAHVRGVEELYRSYRVEVYELVRGKGFDRDERTDSDTRSAGSEA